MRKVSGIRFNDPHFLQEFERAAREKLAPAEFEQLTLSYTVHKLPDDRGVFLEFQDLADAAAFLEKARAVGLPARTFRIVKLIIAEPTDRFRRPVQETDRWARARIEQFARQGRSGRGMLVPADRYQRLQREFDAVNLDLTDYLR